MTDAPEWPREIWMAEREEYDQGVVNAVLSESATVARFEGDTERDREFHQYVDADIYGSSEKYWKARIEVLEAENARLREAINTVAPVIERVAMMKSWHHEAAIRAYAAVSALASQPEDG